ncbi:MAG: hypothetical protein V4556_13540 [Bacteroidota bacterium]
MKFFSVMLWRQTSANYLKKVTVIFVSNLLLMSVAFGQRNINITTSPTSGGTWSGGTTGPYTFTPNADNANVADTAIVNRFLGTGAYSSNNVSIVTSGGGGSQVGNVAVNATLSAGNIDETYYTFTIIANGNITQSSAINFTASSTGGIDDTRRVGKNVVFTAGGSITIGATISTNGNRRNNIGGGAAGNITFTAGTTIAVNAALTLNGANAATDASSNRVGGNGGNVTFTAPSGIVIAANITSDGGNNHGNLVTGNGGAFSFTAASGVNLTGNITANGGIGDAAPDGDDGTIVIDITTTTVTSGGANDGQTSGVIDIGSGTITKTGVGTFLMKGTNIYTGTTFINNGIIKLGSAGVSPNGPLGKITGGTTVANGATLDLNGFTLATAEPIALNGTGISNTGALINSSATAVNYSGTITLASASSIGTIGNITIGNVTGTPGLTKVGIGTLILGTTVTLGSLTVSAGTLSATSAITITGLTTVSAGSLLIAGATLTTTGGAIINGDFQLNPSGFAQSGTWTYGATGKLKFNAAYTVANTHVYFPATNGPTKVFVTVGTVNFGSITRTISDTFSVAAAITNYCNFTLNGVTALQSGGSFGTSCGSGLPVYGCTSTFRYGTGANPQVRGNEWSATATLGNVEIANNTTVNGNIGNAAICGNLIITAGSSLYMDYGSTGSSALTVGKDITINGNLSLGFAAGGDLTIGGNFTHASSGSTINYNNRAVAFNSNLGSVITKTGGGTETFPYLIINKTSGNVQLASGTLLIISALSGDVLQLTNGNLDINGQTLSLTGSGGNIKVTGASQRSITSSSVATVNISGAKTVTSVSAGTLLFDNNITADITASFNPGSSLTTVKGILKLSFGGSVSTNTITYGSASTLIYNQTGTPTFGFEWTGNSTTPGAGVPNNVTIQNTTTVNMPTADRGVAGNLNINSGSLVLNVTSGDLYIGGSWNRTSSGTFTANDRKVFFNSATAATIKAPESLFKDANGSFGGETFPYLIINKNAKTNSVKLLSNICITKTLSITKGSLDIDTSDVVLVSNVTRTADIGVVNTTDAEILYSSTGRFIPQRYIGNTSTIRTWRYLTAPLQASDPLTINEAWQEGQVNANYLTPNATNPYPGFGTHITGTGGIYDGVKGFDQGTAGSNGNSIKYFDNAGGVSHYSFPANTKSTTLMSQLGWAIFVRGDRSYVFGDQYTASGNTTLEPKGKINIGEVTSTVTGGGTLFNVIGNPYPCQINMTNVSIGGSTHANYSLWDPKAFTNYSNTGKFIPFTYVSGTTYTSSNSPVTTWVYPGTVESGEAFLARSATTNVVFHETDKVTGTSTLNGIQSRPVQQRSNVAIISIFRTYLGYFDGTTAELHYIDGTLNLFNDSYNTSVTSSEDVISAMSGTTTGAIRIAKDGYQLSISKEQTISSDDTLYLNISALKLLKHRLALLAENFVPNSTAILIDRYKNATTAVSTTTGDTTFYDFEITADAQSNRSDRFMIVFKPLTTTPVKFSVVKATEQQTSIAIDWKVETIVNTHSYEVERSADGINFTNVNTVTATNATVYNWVDVKPFMQDNYYRIRLVDFSGAITYSQIVKVKTGNAKSGIELQNNPIINNTINLQFVNQQSGAYKIRLYNYLGQTIDSKEIKGIGSWVESFPVNSDLSKGVYDLEIITPANEKVVKKILIQ